MASRGSRARTPGGGVWAPREHLCDLLDAASADVLDLSAFAILDEDLRADRVGPEERAVLPRLATLVERELPSHPFAARMAGTRRRARLSAAATEVLVTDTQQQLPSSILLGDLAALRRLDQEPGDRPVLHTLLCVPTLRRREAHTAAREIAAKNGASLGNALWPVLELHGSRVTIHRSIANGFDFPAFRRSLAASPELTLYDSMVRCGMGAPATLWYADAVAARGLIDWERLWAIAEQGRWLEPVARASALLRARSWDVPAYRREDAWIDRRYWQSTASRPARGTWLAARLAVRSLDRR